MALKLYVIHVFDECLHPKTLPILLLSFHSEKICRVNLASMSGKKRSCLSGNICMILMVVQFIAMCFPRSHLTFFLK